MFDPTTSILESELGPKETLLWSGRPRAGIVFRGADILLIPFSVMWGGGALCWEVSVLSAGISFFALFGVPFVLFGLYMIFGRFIVDAKQRERTYYGVTNERIIIVSGLFGRSVKSLNLRTLTDVTMDQKPDGRGSITFGPTGPYSWWMNTGWPMGNRQAVPCFDTIPDVKTVYEIIRAAQRESS